MRSCGEQILVGLGRVRREQMGSCGRARAQERFSLDASVRHVKELYGEVLGRP
jgi:glycosyltransferase involved in cell wall biosynthesis